MWHRAWPNPNPETYTIKNLDVGGEKNDKRRNHLILVGKSPDAQVVP